MGPPGDRRWGRVWADRRGAGPWRRSRPSGRAGAVRCRRVAQARRRRRGQTTRRTRSAFRALSRGSSVARCVAGARVDQVDAGEVPACDAQTQQQEGAVRGGDLEADSFDGDGAVAASLFARDLGPERATQGIGAGALASDGGPAQVPGERALADLRVLLALVLLLDPGLRGGVEQIEREVGLDLRAWAGGVLRFVPRTTPAFRFARASTAASCGGRCRGARGLRRSRRRAWRRRCRSGARVAGRACERPARGRG